MARTINKSGLLSMDMGQVFTTWWRWWRKELHGLLPAGIRQWLQQADRRLILRLQGNVLQLVTTTDPSHPLQELALEDAPEPQAIHEHLRRHRLEKAPVALQLPAGMVLRRAVSLPASARNNLRTILGYQMASLTPWSQEQVHFGWHLADTAGPMLHLTLYVCPRNKAEPVIQAMDRLGFQAHDLFTDEGLLIKDFLAPSTPASWRQRLRSPLLWLGVLTSILLALTLWLPLHFMSSELAILEARSQRLRAQALEASATRQQLEQIRTETAFLAKRRSRQPPVFMVIEDLADHLPLDAWVYMMRQSGSEAAIWGMAASAKEVLAAMKKSRYWQHAAFEAPAVEDDARNTERFQLRAALVSSGTATQGQTLSDNGLSDALDEEEGLEP
jgi:general secretion pathway protein L